MVKRSCRIKLHRRDKGSQYTLEQGERREIFKESGSDIWKILKNNIDTCVEIIGTFGKINRRYIKMGKRKIAIIFEKIEVLYKKDAYCKISVSNNICIVNANTTI